MTRLGLIINPTSGKGNGKVHGELAKQTFLDAGIEVIDLSAQSFEEARANGAKAISEGQLDGLVVAGGDGMAHLGVNLCAGTKVPMGLIACGTGNDAARTLGLPLVDGAAGAKAIIAGNTRLIDLGHGKNADREFHFFGSISAGFDAVVNARANKWTWPKGPSRYILAMLRELTVFKPLKYSAVIDGVQRNIEAMLCAVANAKSFGGGMLIAPEASIEDGELDLFIVHPLSRPAFLKMFPKVYTGAHVTHPAVEILRTKKLSLDAGNIPTFADGEYVGNKPMEISVAPRAVSVFVA
ncbi:MAG: diacylglycerol/lipid kinase family protein [Microbacteriaceae bacterium]